VRAAHALPPRSALPSIAIAIAVSALLCGCGGGDDETPRGAPSRGPAGVQAPPPTKAEPRAPLRAGGRPASTGSTWRPTPVPATARERTEDERDEPGERPTLRDYGGELQAALGVPGDCIDRETARAAGSTLRIPVRVVVTESGRVTRAEVGGTLPEAARLCVQRRAEAVSMRAPIEGAPRSISTDIVLQATFGPDPQPAAEPEWRRPPGSQAPGITLPAVGAEGRPTGTVAPDRTLPAVGAEGRPEGWVPPSSTLPATAD
jgi:hypothetical protein